MADCHSLFQEFNQHIRLNDSRRQALVNARNDLRMRISNSFNSIKQQLPSVHEMEYQTQGSFIMDTIINPISEDYDLDDGVYFIGGYTRANRPETKWFHDFVIKSITTNNASVKEVKDKDTCVRALYNEGYAYLFENKSNTLSKGFHVDLPIYYATTKKSPDLAHLKQSWIVSDPIEFIKWFEDKVQSNFRSEFLYETKLYSAQLNSWQDLVRKQDAQLRRIVRYLKAWCDYKGKNMPCGIILTILAANNYSPADKDDVSLKETLVNIKVSLDAEFVCRRPTTPQNENLLEGYEHQAAFKQNLADFVESAKQAINEGNQKRACSKWQLHFGNRFSCLNASDFDQNVSRYTSPAIITGNAKSA